MLRACQVIILLLLLLTLAAATAALGFSRTSLSLLQELI